MTIKRDSVFSVLEKEKIRCFTISDICSLFSISGNYASQIVYQLKLEEKVEEIEKGKYILTDCDIYPLLIGYKTVCPSYISFKTALYAYNIREERGDEIYVATPKRKKTLDFKSYIFKYITLKPYKFFGYREIYINGNKVTIAEPEKAIIDSFEELNYGPEVVKFTDTLMKALNIISIEKLIHYAKRFRDKSLLARLGYMLDVIGIKRDIPDKFLPKDYIKLNPSGERRGKWVSKWKIIDNR